MYNGSSATTFSCRFAAHPFTCPFVRRYIACLTACLARTAGQEDEVYRSEPSSDGDDVTDDERPLPRQRQGTRTSARAGAEQVTDGKNTMGLRLVWVEQGHMRGPGTGQTRGGAHRVRQPLARTTACEPCTSTRIYAKQAKAEVFCL